MPLVLVVSDLHIPQRAADIPAKFKKMLVPGKIDRIICAGNICGRDTYDYLRGVTADLHAVMGEFDEIGKDLPEFTTVKVGDISIGVIHGHQVIPWGDQASLAMWQRKLDCDVLVSGNTHKYKAFEKEGKFFLNPGSITGAYSASEDDVTPSFVLMDIQGKHVTCFVYQLDAADELKVKKKEWTKE